MEWTPGISSFIFLMNNERQALHSFHGCVLREQVPSKQPSGPHLSLAAHSRSSIWMSSMRLCLTRRKGSEWLYICQKALTSTKTTEVFIFLHEPITRRFFSPLAGSHHLSIILALHFLSHGRQNSIKIHSHFPFWEIPRSLAKHFECMLCGQCNVPLTTRHSSGKLCKP